jgi:hypothetical protein
MILAEWPRPEKQRIARCFRASETNELEEYLQEYQRCNNIPADVVLRGTLAFDATSVSHKGMERKRGKNRSCFAFVMLPHDHRFKNLLIQSVPQETGRIDEFILRIHDAFCGALSRIGIVVNFVATDGDNGPAKAHLETFKQHDKCRGDLDLAVCQVTKDGTVELIQWPVSDLLHLLKNARSRLAKGTLSFYGRADEVLTGKTVTRTLGKVNVGTNVEAQSSLDLLKDNLALEAFCPGNLLRLWETNKTGGYFMLSFVSLRFAVMTEVLAAEMRLGLLRVAFYMFFKMMEGYPCTGAEGGIYKVSKRAGVKKTLWIKEVCCRGANLCVALASIIRNYAALGIQFLAINRIGTHPVECQFGTTRGMLRGETRWERFLSAQVDAVVLGEIQEQLCLRT